MASSIDIEEKEYTLLIGEELKHLRYQKEKIQKRIECLVKLCKHEDLSISEYDTAKCNICLKSFNWYCPTSPSLTCEYEFIDEDGEKDYNEDDCIYCHQPQERK